MNAKINLKVTGVRGNKPNYTENKGRVVSFVGGTENNIHNDYIAVDAFEGYGETYKRRENCEVEVSIDGFVWRGTPNEMIKKLTSK